MRIEIDSESGFCFGVVNAIRKTEEEMARNGRLASLGDIVHNKVEIKRLEELGLTTVSAADLPRLKGERVLIRAHGEPPETYALAASNHITLIDATCPVVARLQKKIVAAFRAMEECGGQVVLLGKHGHAEVIGLNGQIGNRAIVIQNTEELIRKVDFSRPIYLLSQTTMPRTLFREVCEEIDRRVGEREAGFVTIADSICRNFSNREPHLVEFAGRFDVILFVSGKKSSNGMALYSACLQSNPRSYKIEDEQEIDWSWFEGVGSVGICGATSTPRWLMEKVGNAVAARYNGDENKI